MSKQDRLVNRLEIEIRYPAPWTLGSWVCEEHRAVVLPAGQCRGEWFDERMRDSVAFRAAIAFGDWS